MVREEKLSAVLSDFASTMLTDFPIQKILDRLVERTVDVLPIAAAGVTLIAPGMAPRYVAASNESALRYEKLQTELGEGPCLAAYTSGEAVVVSNLRQDDRFPIFSPQGLAAGLRAVFAFPLWHADARLGALDLYRQTPGPLEAEDMTAAQTLADVAAAYLLNADSRAEARETSDRFRDNALHDALTGLPNRTLLQQRFEHAAMRARRSGNAAAVLFADLDRFKRVNDTFGHHVGDELLVAVAQRLVALLRPGDTCARVSGDEFVILCEDLSTAEDAELLAARIHGVLATPFVLSQGALNISASVGIAFAGRGEDVSGQLLRDADAAMYRAKREGGGRDQIFDIRRERQARTQVSLDSDLRSAFADGELDVHYQPIVRSVDGQLLGAEALLRWRHPTRGSIAAAAIVAVAERIELIGEIGAWVLEGACRDRARWLTSYPARPLNIAVNVSVHQLMAQGFCAMVAGVLDRTGTEPEVLTLDVTEGVYIQDAERTVTVLSDLRQLGVKLALDDFGSGVSSLNYLREFPVDILKIDHVFLADICHDPAVAAVVTAITELAHDLGLGVVAEGVETQEQRDLVVAIGCEAAQGFFYARPASANEMEKQLGATSASIVLPDARTSLAAPQRMGTTDRPRPAGSSSPRSRAD